MKNSVLTRKSNGCKLLIALCGAMALTVATAETLRFVGGDGGSWNADAAWQNAAGEKVAWTDGAYAVISNCSVKLPSDVSAAGLEWYTTAKKTLTGAGKLTIGADGVYNSGTSEINVQNAGGVLLSASQTWRSAGSTMICMDGLRAVTAAEGVVLDVSGGAILRWNAKGAFTATNRVRFGGTSKFSITGNGTLGAPILEFCSAGEHYKVYSGERSNWTTNTVASEIVLKNGATLTVPSGTGRFAIPKVSVCESADTTCTLALASPTALASATAYDLDVAEGCSLALKAGVCANVSACTILKKGTGTLNLSAQQPSAWQFDVREGVLAPTLSGTLSNQSFALASGATLQIPAGCEIQSATMPSGEGTIAFGAGGALVLSTTATLTSADFARFSGNGKVLAANGVTLTCDQTQVGGVSVDALAGGRVEAAHLTATAGSAKVKVSVTGSEGGEVRLAAGGSFAGSNTEFFVAQGGRLTLVGGTLTCKSFCGLEGKGRYFGVKDSGVLKVLDGGNLYIGVEKDTDWEVFEVGSGGLVDVSKWANLCVGGNMCRGLLRLTGGEMRVARGNEKILAGFTTYAGVLPGTARLEFLGGTFETGRTIEMASADGSAAWADALVRFTAATTLFSGTNTTDLAVAGQSTVDTAALDCALGLTAVRGDGTLVKQGEGAFGVRDLPTGMNVRIEGGRVTLAGDEVAHVRPCGTPAAWVDATVAGSMTVSGANVTRWRDRRVVEDASFAFVATNCYNAPQLVANALNGHPVVDFGRIKETSGTYKQDGDNRMMEFASYLDNIRAVCWVIGSKNGGGFLLGDNKVDGSKRHFHRGTGYGTRSNQPIWATSNDKGVVSAGETRLNGTNVVGTTAGLSGAYDLVTWRLTAEQDAAGKVAGASWFATCYKESGGRLNGGQELGEVLIYTNRLTDAELADTERYLQSKWFPAQKQPLRLGTVTLAGTTATFSVEEGRDVTVARVVVGSAATWSAQSVTGASVVDMAFEDGACVAMSVTAEGLASFAASGDIALPASLRYTLTVAQGAQIPERATILTAGGTLTGRPSWTRSGGRMASLSVVGSSLVLNRTGFLMIVR